MTYAMKPLTCDPARIKGMSERLILSHYENNYGGAVKRLNLIDEKLAELDYASAPGFLINGLKREQLIAMNSMILHELFFDGLGEQGEPDTSLREALVRDFGSYERWRAEFIAMGKALGGGSGWVLLAWSPRDRKLVNQWASDHTPHACGRHAHSGARHVRALLSHRFRRQGRDLCRDLHGRRALEECRSAVRRDEEAMTRHKTGPRARIIMRALTTVLFTLPGVWSVLSGIAVILPSLTGAVHAQAPPTELLRLETRIPLGEVRGRIDHMAIDRGRNRLIVAELENDSVAIVDLNDRKVIHVITGLKEPQGVAYVPSTDMLYVANAGDGSVRLFRGGDYAPAGAIELGDDADNIRIDPSSKTVFVGYGSGALAVIDAATQRKIADMPLGAHPESFQLTPDGGRIYVNLPTARAIAVLDAATRKRVATWPASVGQRKFRDGARRGDPTGHCGLSHAGQARRLFDGG